MICRDATPADLPAIDALFRQSFADTFAHLYAPHDLAAFFAKFTPKAWADELAQPDLALRLAEEDGALLGLAKVSDPTLPVAIDRPSIELRQLYLAEAAKGRGVADALMAWALDIGRARGAEAMILSVYVDNHRARRFYERHGFVEIGRYVFMVGNHADDDRIMRREL